MPVLIVTKNTLFKKTAAQSSALSPANKVGVNAGQVFEVNYAFRVGQHCLVQLQQGLGSVGKQGFFFLPHVSVPLAEARGTWLTHIDSEVLHSRENIERGLKQLKKLGFNTIYPTVWDQGFTLYPSRVAKAFVGSAMTPDPLFSDRDMLAEIVELARPLNLRVIPWFEYGLAAPPESQVEQRNSHLLTLDSNGNKIRTKTTDGKLDDFVWFNPCRPEVQIFIVNLVAEVVAHYDVDGIQLDDHFGFPVELGYDAFTEDLYQAENRGNPIPADLKDANRGTWMAGKLTGLLTQIYRAVKANRRDSIVSISPNPLGFSKSNYMADWQFWDQEGLIDELVLQVYRDSASNIAGELSKQEVIDAAGRVPTLIGLLTGLKFLPVSTGAIHAQLQEVRKRDLTGVSCFFHETLLHEQLSPIKIPRSPADLKQLFPEKS